MKQLKTKFQFFKAPTFSIKHLITYRNINGNYSTLKRYRPIKYKSYRKRCQINFYFYSVTSIYRKFGKFISHIQLEILIKKAPLPAQISQPIYLLHTLQSSKRPDKTSGSPFPLPHSPQKLQLAIPRSIGPALRFSLSHSHHPTTRPAHYHPLSPHITIGIARTERERERERDGRWRARANRISASHRAALCHNEYPH